MKCFEYKDTHADLGTRNRLGKDGWELVAVIRENIHSPTGTTRVNTFYFKRPLVSRAKRK